MSSKKSLAREFAFQFLYHLIREHSELMGIWKDELESFEETTLDEEQQEGLQRENIHYQYALELIQGVVEEKQELDSLLSPLLSKDSLERMNAIDRVLLTLGTYEITRQKAPKKVVLSEMIQLAQKYGTEKSYSLVNGVLDRVSL